MRTFVWIVSLILFIRAMTKLYALSERLYETNPVTLAVNLAFDFLLASWGAILLAR